MTKAAELLGKSDYSIPDPTEIKNETAHPNAYNLCKKAKNAEEWLSLLRCHRYGSVYAHSGNGGGKIPLVCGTSEIRAGADQLSAIISVRLKMNPFDGDIYVFCGQRRDLVRYVHWDGCGFQITDRRREYGRYAWPRSTLGTIITIDANDFDFLLRGLTVSA